MLIKTRMVPIMNMYIHENVHYLESKVHLRHILDEWFYTSIGSPQAIRTRTKKKTVVRRNVIIYLPRRSHQAIITRKTMKKCNIK